MAEATPRRSFWLSVRKLPERTPLRVKLITVLLALVCLALVIISIAGISFIRSYLLTKADNQLAGLTNQAAAFGGRFPENAQFGPDQWVYDFVTDGKVIAVWGNMRPGSAGPMITPNASWLSARPGTYLTIPGQTASTRWRVVAHPGWQLTDPGTGTSTTGTLVVGVNVTTQYETLGELTTADLLVSLCILLIIGLVTTALVRASLRPLTDVEKTAGAIAAGDLSKRVPERDPRTEMGRLGRSLNAMLSQIESAFQSRSRSEAAAKRSEERMRQFVADASHELRTPLTAIRGFAEYYRQRGGIAVDDAAPAASTNPDEGTSAVGAANEGRSKAAHPLAPADMDRIMRRVEQESARMGILVEDMLLLARLDQQRPLSASPVDLLTLAADAVHDARVVAPARSINLTVSSGRALLVIGDEVRLRQVIGNLMSNALTHTPEGTPIDVLIRSGNLDEAATATAVARRNIAEPSLDEEPGSDDGREHNGHATDHRPATGRAPGGPAAVLEVADHGPGLTAEQAGHVFERFYRADAARTTGGTGLGLAIVAALIAAHGGAAWVRSRPGDGATFCIALPLSPEAMQGAENDFDYDADDISAETGEVENGVAVNGSAQNGSGTTGAAEAATPGTVTPETDAANTASATAELGS
ncbi:MAG TPA: HAMP domain-containing sensor histidine kinase [Streptosporangiaceae bacterium]|nr:HAMP domain-containing sensor histidine kinase [Streptosporangiaceae bacterium]